MDLLLGFVRIFICSSAYRVVATLTLCALIMWIPLKGEGLLLRDNLKRARTGDFIVTAQGKNYSLLHIYSKQDQALVIEEISIPCAKIPKKHFSWSSWVLQGAPGNTLHVMYTVDLNTAQMKNYYSFTRAGWYEMSTQDNFLSTLLNLQFEEIPWQQRRRVGQTVLSSSNERRSIWQPKMVIEGQEISGVNFSAWKTIWPKDQSDLAGRSIEVYLPEDGYGYPAYFPYWLQISGFVGGAKVRIVDSGTGLRSNLSYPYHQTKK